MLRSQPLSPARSKSAPAFVFARFLRPVFRFAFRSASARALVVVPLGLSAGCFYDSSWGGRKTVQAHNAARATPASLTSPEATSKSGGQAMADDGARVLRVRVHGTPAYAAQTPDWKSHVASLLAQASTTLDASVGARLVVDASDPWEHAAAARLDADLAALREEDTGDGADLVIGFVGGLPLTTQDFEQLGLSELPGTHLVVRAPRTSRRSTRRSRKAFDGAQVRTPGRDSVESAFVTARSRSSSTRWGTRSGLPTRPVRGA